MNTYRLSVTNLINPWWFNRVRSGKHSAIVSADGTSVLMEGVSLTFRGECPAPGTPGQVWIDMSGNFVFATDADIAQDRIERLAAEAARVRAERVFLNNRRADAEAFNALICLPVKWKPGIKDTLSGLSESSCGDGRNAATVNHICLLEPMIAGRLTREAGDFLCTAASGSNGKRYTFSVDVHEVDGDDRRYESRITCKKCLSLARRWMKPIHRELCA